MKTEAYEISPQVIHENLEGEVILINMNTGVYFSLNPVAAEIWSGVQQRAPIPEISRHLGGKYKGEMDVIDGEVRKLLEAMLKEGLIQPAVTPGGFRESAPSAGSSSMEFTPPVLERYRDMQDLLLLDPIHDVNESTGWPHVKKG